MQALLIPRPGELTLGEISRPTPGLYDALVRIEGCGICATTDRELIHGRQPFHDRYPAVLGHEAVGRVEETGGKVTAFRPGDRVTRPVAIWPGQTRDGLASAWGGCAEYGLVCDWRAMERNGDPSMGNDYTAVRQQVVPPELSLAESVLAISLAETASWFWHLPPVGGRTVCVAGTGIAGLGMVLWSLLAGADNIIVLGRRRERLDLAREIGATHTIDTTAGKTTADVRGCNGGRGVDFFLEAVGKPDQVEVGLSVVCPGGTVAVYGVPEGQRYALSWGWGPGHAAVVQYPAEEHRAYGWVARAIARKLIPVEKLMTHQWPLGEYREAYATVDGGGPVKGWLRLAG